MHGPQYLYCIVGKYCIPISSMQPHASKIYSLNLRFVNSCRVPPERNAARNSGLSATFPVCGEASILCYQQYAVDLGFLNRPKP